MLIAGTIDGIARRSNGFTQSLRSSPESCCLARRSLLYLKGCQTLQVGGDVLLADHTLEEQGQILLVQAAGRLTFPLEYQEAGKSSTRFEHLRLASSLRHDRS